MINAELKQTLEELGFTKGEAKVYLALLELGSTTLGPIVKSSGISRSKVYDILERLAQKGVVSKIQKKEGLTFQALPPEALLGYLATKKKVLEQEEKRLKAALPLLQKLAPKPKVEVMVYEGFDGFKALIDRATSELEKGDVYEAMGISKTTEAMRYYAKRIHEIQTKKRYIVRSIFDELGAFKIAERITPLHEIRILPPGWHTPALFTAYKDTATIQFGKGENIVCIAVRNEDIATSFKTAFKAMWKISKPFKTATFKTQ